MLGGVGRASRKGRPYPIYATFCVALGGYTGKERVIAPS